MLPIAESLRDYVSEPLRVATKLTPLSIVVAAFSLIVAALSFLNTLRQAKIKRQQERAQRFREMLSTAGIAAYTLAWSLVGNLDISTALLQLLEAIETRLGKSPSMGAIEELLEERLLISSMIGKAWRDSGIVAKFRQDTIEFGRIHVAIGNQIPLAQEALEVINAKLRTLLISDILLMRAMRNEKNWPTGISKPVNYLFERLSAAATVPEEEIFSEGCQLLSGFAGVIALADDMRVLKLLEPPSALFRTKEYVRIKYRERKARLFRREIAAKLAHHRPEECLLLCEAVDSTLRLIKNARKSQQRLQLSADRVADLFGGLEGSDALEMTAKNFLDYRIVDGSKKAHALVQLLRLECLGVVDPEVDFRLAVEADVLSLVKSAGTRGAQGQVTIPKLLDRHGSVQPTSDADWFRGFERRMQEL